MDRAGLVGEDGQTHMGLYDIAYMLAVPGMTVTAPKDGDELIGLLRTALAHTGGPFCTRYPRDKAPTEPRPVAEIPAVPYGTWESLRAGRDLAILAVGTMVQPALQAAERLAADGIDAAVVNCRFLKPLDPRDARGARCSDHRTIVTVEEGTVVNGFGAYLARDAADDASRGARRRPRHPRQADGAGASPRPAGGVRAHRRRDRRVASPRCMHEESLEAR